MELDRSTIEDTVYSRIIDKKLETDVGQDAERQQTGSLFQSKSNQRTHTQRNFCMALQFDQLAVNRLMAILFPKLGHFYQESTEVFAIR